jgi:sporulation protein YlmC with PRC-barrel domain
LCEREFAFFAQPHEGKMLRHESDINGYAIHASDGSIGTVRDFLFDDATWMVRWLVVDTGNWLPGREILLPPSAVEHVNHIGHQFNVKLTRQQVKDCPEIDSHLPVSRQHETSLYDYYGWSPYWGDGAYMGLVRYGGGGETEPPSTELMHREKEVDDARRSKNDIALRSVKEVNGYHIHANDGEIGHVEDILVEDSDWSIRYLIVDTTNWWPATDVLISPMSVRTIQWADRLVNLRVDRQTVKESLPYESLAKLGAVDCAKIHKYDNKLRKRRRLSLPTTV